MVNWLPVWNGVPLFVTQFDGSRFSTENCTQAAGAMLVWVSSGGTKKVTGGQMRANSGDSNQDGSPGTNLTAMAKAAKSFGVSVENVFQQPYSSFRAKMTDRSAVVAGYYSFVPSKYRLQQSGWGDHSPHAVFVYRYYPQYDAYWVMDPLGKNKRDYKGEWWPASVMKAFAWSDYGLVSGRLYGNASFQTQNLVKNAPLPPFTGASDPVQIDNPTGGETPTTVSEIFKWNGLLNSIKDNLHINADTPLNSTQLFAIATYIAMLLHPKDGAGEWQAFASDLLGGDQVTESGYMPQSKYKPDPVLAPFRKKIEAGQTVTLNDIIDANPSVTQTQPDQGAIDTAVGILQSVVDIENWLYVGAMGLGLLMAAYGLNIVLNAGGMKAAVGY